MIQNWLDVSSSTAANGTSGTPAPANKSTTAGVDSLASEQTFLKLFVAQLKNQDPSSPQDPTQFVTQLAQFSGLEQSLQMRQDLDAILKAVQANSTTGTPPASQK